MGEISYRTTDREDAMQIVTVGFGAAMREVRIPDAWTAFVVDGRIYRRTSDGFAFVGRVAGESPKQLERVFKSEKALAS